MSILEAQKRGQQKYKINTFDTQASYNYDKAINYYNLKIQSLLKMMETRTLSELKTEQDLEAYLSQVTFAFNKDWETLYNSKAITYDVMKQTVDSLSQQINSENENTAKKIDYVVFLNELAKNAGLSNLNFNNDNLPAFLDLSGLERIWTKLQKGENTSIPNLMGEIFEQGITGVLQNALGEIFAQIEQTGSAYVKGKKVKPDALLSLESFTIQDAAIDRGKKKPMKNNVIEVGGDVFNFEIMDLIDLSEYGNNVEAMKGLANMVNPGIIGMTAKQWTDSASYKSIAKFKIPSTEPFTKAELEGMKDSTLRLYNTWVISKYLISVLGSLNLVIASGSHTTTTSSFLRNLTKKQSSNHYAKTR